MNYQKLHDNIISKAKLRKCLKREIGFHIHHILPKSMCGSNYKSNLVKLTYKEHFVIHHLLFKIYKNREMTLAFNIMCHGKNRIKISQIQYEKLMKLCGELSSGENNGMFGKRHSKESKEKMSESRTGLRFTDERKERLRKRVSGNGNIMFGKKRSEEVKRKLSKSRGYYIGNIEIENEVYSFDCKYDWLKFCGGNNINGVSSWKSCIKSRTPIVYKNFKVWSDLK